MSKTPWQTVLLVLALFLLLSPAASAQTQKTSSKADAGRNNTKAVKGPDKLSLQSVTLTSTAEAARKAAEEATARTSAPKTTQKNSKQSGSSDTTEGAVLEFRATDGPPASAVSAGGFQEKGHKKSVLKDIHGSAYGATASAAGSASAEGGAVGAGSSNGKFNVYVEGEHTHASTPVPH